MFGECYVPHIFLPPRSPLSVVPRHCTEDEKLTPSKGKEEDYQNNTALQGETNRDGKKWAFPNNQRFLALAGSFDKQSGVVEGGRSVGAWSTQHGGASLWKGEEGRYLLIQNGVLCRIDNIE